jgi:hypothetical protein
MLESFETLLLLLGEDRVGGDGGVGGAEIVKLA